MGFLPTGPCATSVLGMDVEWLVSKLAEAADKAREILRRCPGGDRELCKMMLDLLEEVVRGNRLAIFLVLPVDDNGEAVDAVYAEGEEGAWIAVSPHALADIGYAAHALIHELAHAAGLEEDDIAEALALYAVNAADVPEPPELVQQAEEKLRKSGCTARLSGHKELYLVTVKLQD